MELSKGDTLHVTYQHPLFGTVTATGRVLSTDARGALVDFNGVRTIVTQAKLAKMENVLVEPKTTLFDLFRRA